jgi:hypothetical protein
LGSRWVLTVPFELSLLLAAKPDALSAVGRIFIKEIQRWQRQQTQALGFDATRGWPSKPSAAPARTGSG